MLSYGEMYDFKLFEGFGFRQTDRQTDKRKDIGGCRVTFATEKISKIVSIWIHVVQNGHYYSETLKSGKYCFFP